MNWMNAIGNTLVVSLFAFAYGEPILAKGAEAIKKEAIQLSGGWVGTIKIVPKNLDPVMKFNVQMKFSNPRPEDQYGYSYYYDVMVNIAPEGQPLVRSHFSNSTIGVVLSKISGTYDYENFLGDFHFVRPRTYDAGFLVGCEHSMSMDGVNMTTPANGPWKGRLKCYSDKTGRTHSGEIILQRGQFDETAKAADVVPLDRYGMPISPGQNFPAQRQPQQGEGVQPPPSPINGSGGISPIDEVKDRVPGVLRRIFR
jgi:hypothetical protein